MADIELEGLRETEIFTLQAIFPELIFKPEDPYTASISIPISPAKPILVTFAPPSDQIPPPTPPISNHKGKGRDTGEDGSQRAPIFTLLENNEIVRSPPTPRREGKGRDVVERTPVEAPINDIPQPATEIYELSHFPQILLEFTLPEGYPENAPPVIKASTSPPWLTENTLRVLEKKCGQLWEDLGRELVMYTYIDHLKEALDTDFFDQMRSAQKDKLLVEKPDGSVGIELYGQGTDKDAPLHIPQGVMIVLLEFDTNAKREEFERQTFDCGVCLEPKKGSFCHRMIACRHVFCVECLQDFYNNCIKEGEVKSVRCLDPGCGKEKKKEDETKTESSTAQKRRKKDDRTLSPNELLQIPIDEEMVDRYIDLKRRAELAADKKTVYCPRKWCQGAARSKKHPKPAGKNAGREPEEDPSSDEEDEEDEEGEEGELEETSPVSPKTVKSPKPFYADRLRICEDCSYAFCKVCRAGWHGDWVYCAPRDITELTEEEKASMEYMRDHSQPCPTCQTRIQKMDGCNKMTCSKCSTFFCYLCGSWLMPHNPYHHFNNPGMDCYTRLWDLEQGDDPEMEGGGGNAGEQVEDVLAIALADAVV